MSDWGQQKLMRGNCAKGESPLTQIHSEMADQRMPNFHQDWDTVIVRKRAIARKAAGAAASANKPRVRFTEDAERLRKLEAADGPTKPKQMSAASRQEMIQRRNAAGWSQMELNTRCSFPPNTIREIEAGRLCPNGAILNVLNRVLGASLRL